MRILSYIICTILIIFGVSFSVLNSVEVPVNYFFGQSIIYFPLLFLIILMIGALLGMVAMIPILVKLKMQKRE